MEIEHVDHIAAEEAVDDVADYSRVEKRLGDRSEVWKFGRFGGLEGKDRASLPDQEREGDETEDGERPDLALEHPPCAAAVLDVGEVEEPRNDGNRRGVLEVACGEFLDDGIRQNEVRDGREEDEETLHFVPRSIALWHSMHVRTNGWLRRRGLRMSCPHDVHTP